MSPRQEPLTLQTTDYQRFVGTKIFASTAGWGLRGGHPVRTDDTEGDIAPLDSWIHPARCGRPDVDAKIFASLQFIDYQ